MLKKIVWESRILWCGCQNQMLNAFISNFHWVWCIIDQFICHAYLLSCFCFLPESKCSQFILRVATTFFIWSSIWNSIFFAYLFHHLCFCGYIYVLQRTTQVSNLRSLRQIAWLTWTLKQWLYSCSDFLINLCYSAKLSSLTFWCIIEFLYAIINPIINVNILSMSHFWINNWSSNIFH